MIAVFWNSRQRRLRTLWRLLLAGVIFFVLNLALGAAGTLAFAVWLITRPGNAGLATDPAALLRALAALPAFHLFTYGASLATIVLTVLVAGRFLDRRRFVDFGLHLSRAWWADLGFGLGLGALLMLGIFLVERALGWVTVTGTFQAAGSSRSFAVGIASAVLAYLAVGIYEELLFRGYALRNLAEGLNVGRFGRQGALLAAWLLSSAVFGLAHAANPNATVVSTTNIVVAGLFLGLGFVLTGELAIPVGLHITWNFFQGNVFGFPVSGTDAGATFVGIAQHGPDLWTGGAFGPEAGLLGIGALLAGSLAVAAWVRYRQGRLALCSRLAEAPQPAPPAPLGSQAEHSQERQE